MSAVVPAHEIERKVGAKRHPTQHVARADSASEMVYLLHSKECRDSRVDLRTCPYSQALDNGIDAAGDWQDFTDMAVQVRIHPVSKWLVPTGPAIAGKVLCPECEARKCINCCGEALEELTDSIVSCGCLCQTRSYLQGQPNVALLPPHLRPAYTTQLRVQGLGIAVVSPDGGVSWTHLEP